MSDKPEVKTSSLVDQLQASLVQAANHAREAMVAAKVEAQNLVYEQASIYIDTVREFIDKPGNILGSAATKHGEIAEVAEVGVKNAWDVLYGLDPSASLHPERTGSIDYIIDGEDVQSKFCNGLTKTLRGVNEHSAKYENFLKGNAYYAIPHDQAELLQKVMNGEETGLSSQAVAAIKRQVEAFESTTGKSVGQAIKPATFDYKEVQLGAIDDTLDAKQAELAGAHEDLVEEIREKFGPSLKEGMQAAAVAAAVGAGISFTRAAFAKHQAGKNIFKGDFTIEDWKEVGIDTGKGAALGGLAGGSLYLMTNCAGMSAPLAGAVVSAAKGLAPLVKGYHAGTLSLEELVDSGTIVCAEVGMVAAGAAIGQALIPVPILGALIGSVAGQVLSSMLSREVQGSAKVIAARTAEYKAKLDAKQQEILDSLVAQFARLGELTVAAFDFRLNADILGASVELAQTYGVEESKILRSIGEVERYLFD
jgi:hypothetical protein